MDSIQNRIIAFTKLGDFLSQFSEKGITKKETVAFNELFFDGFKHQITIAQEHNSWFTKDNILFAIENLATALSEKSIRKFVQSEFKSIKTPKKIGVVMAGNIPLVGFHDFFCVLISGHSIVIKQSSNDLHLLPFVAKYLEYVEPTFKGKITFSKEKITDFDAIIATGSTNTSRYFEYYFKNKPNIIRKSRNSCAVLTGNETAKELEDLSEDVFRFFGLGCRSVSKLYVPKDYDFNLFFKGMYAKNDLIKNAKYANNYDYNKAVYLMSQFDILENGFLMIKEDTSYSSPIATIFYEYYQDETQLKEKLKQDTEQIQCIVSNGFIKNEIAFGHTQHPTLSQYADDVNTMNFLAII